MGEDPPEARRGTLGKDPPEARRGTLRGTLLVM